MLKVMSTAVFGAEMNENDIFWAFAVAKSEITLSVNMESSTACSMRRTDRSVTHWLLTKGTTRLRTMKASSPL